MLERVLPAGVVVAETRRDEEASLFAEEELTVVRAVEKRRREFATGRACARRALAQLGFPPLAVPSGLQGAPVWPAGIVGSITHCAGYRASAVAHASRFASVGIDAEVDDGLPPGLLTDVALPVEQGLVEHLGKEHAGPSWDRLLFSIKESVYKAWFPLAERWLGFEDAEVTIDPRSHSFSVRLLVPGPSMGGRQLRSLAGRWVAESGLLLTAIALPAGKADVADDGG